MKVHTATLAGGDNNQDRVFVTDNAVVVLDGASAFEPVDVDAGRYAETIGASIADQLKSQPSISIADAVASSIRHAVSKLDLTRGHSPSSTVSVFRARPDFVDLYVLGDSPIYYGFGGDTHVHVDRRLSGVAVSARDHYTSSLRAGRGYGAEHHAALVELQREQHDSRNIPGGYWIAETHPEAAARGLLANVDRSTITWAILATDGAADLIDYNGLNWPNIARHNSKELTTLLSWLAEWETAVDPIGKQLPRAKQHDDKTIAVLDLR